MRQSQTNAKWLAAIIVISCLLTVSCGGRGGMTAPLVLAVTPAVARASTDFSLNQFTPALLTATLSDGTIPTNIQWTTTNGCIAPGSNLQNTTTVVCNFTCGTGSATATITATAQGQTATSSVACTWQ